MAGQSKLGRNLTLIGILAVIGGGMGWIGFMNRRQVVRNATLFDSVARDDLPKVEELLELGADPNIKLLNERPEGFFNFCKQLVGLDPRQSEGGHTALMLAAENDQPAIVKALLDAGASVTVYDKEGRTALLWAVRANRPETPAIILLLIQRGADPRFKGIDGKSAWDLAARHSTTLKALQQAVTKK